MALKSSDTEGITGRLTIFSILNGSNDGTRGATHIEFVFDFDTYLRVPTDHDMYQKVESPSRRIQAIWTSFIRVIDDS